MATDVETFRTTFAGVFRVEGAAHPYLGYRHVADRGDGQTKTLPAGAAAGFALLLGVPAWADLPLNVLLRYQPDIGYGVTCGAITFTLAGLFGALVKSKCPPAAAR